MARPESARLDPDNAFAVRAVLAQRASRALIRRAAGVRPAVAPASRRPARAVVRPIRFAGENQISAAQNSIFTAENSISAAGQDLTRLGGSPLGLGENPIGLGESQIGLGGGQIRLTGPGSTRITGANGRRITSLNGRRITGSNGRPAGLGLSRGGDVARRDNSDRTTATRTVRAKATRRAVTRVRSVVRRTTAPVTHRVMRLGNMTAVVAFARSQVGRRYVSGGEGRGGFDCSGLTKQAYARAGIRLPHSSGAQAARARRISRSQARPGDLVVGPGHVGIYMGNGMMIDAGNHRTGVVYRKLYSGLSVERL
ncbi:C40 family peptidase [Actinoplanes sp. CA-030573]|uniref:C40 family peptidase n=1 Tax=Actinoplanes sp. CA-030573 TaxID=3239898 RepID=UPI003D8C8E99